MPQPLLDMIAAKTGEEVSVETLTGVSQKRASLKVDLLNKTLLLQRITEGGIAREIARMASLGLLDHNDPSKPSHRLTNGREPSKTIESDGSNIKNHRKTIDGNG